MSALHETGTPTTGPQEAAARPRHVQSGHGRGGELLLVLGWFVVAGVLGGVLWWWRVDLPQVTKSGGDVLLDPGSVSQQVSIDGWFALIALGGGFLSAGALTLWRTRDPIATVLLSVLGAGLASYLMVRVGGFLGPGDPVAALRSMPDGSRVAMPLALHAPGVAWLWPLGAALGAFAVITIVVGDPRREQVGQESPDRPAGD